MRTNCWEAKQCGRQPGGEKSDELGTCPVSIETKAHGIHGGTNGGRACWAIGGTLCGGKVQGAFASKLGSCLQCDFYSSVRSEEAGNMATSKEILETLKSTEMV